MPTDAERLDFLDRCNAKLNEQSGTRYGWKFHRNHNRVAVLEDSHIPVLTVREAIDVAMQNESC